MRQGLGQVNSISEAQGLDSSLIETVDKVLERVLGEVGTGAVYGMLQSRFGLDKASIPARMDYFRESLVELLGSGGEVLLRMIDSGTRDE
jgi:hypothetical protein